MKVSIISFNSTGASALYPLQMIKALAESKKCELQVIAASRAYNIADYQSICKIHDIDLYEFETYEHHKTAVFWSFFNVKRFISIVEIIKGFQPDVIYFPFGCVWAVVLYPILRRIAPIIETLHDPHPHDESTGIVESFFRWTNAYVMKYVSGIVVLNSKDDQYVRNKYKRPVVVIPHAAFSLYTKLAKGIDCTRIKHQICFIGRIEPYKGLDILVEAFRKVRAKNVKLVIAGKGTISDSTMQKILINNRITLIHRYVSDEEMVNIIENSDFLVLPYLRASQSGVIPMAFALGRTVIATNVGALSEQVPGTTGKLVPPDVDSIANAIDEMYDDEQKIVEYSMGAKNYAEEKLTWEHSVKLLFSFFQTFLENK